jgi:hypothetical protein
MNGHLEASRGVVDQHLLAFLSRIAIRLHPASSPPLPSPPTKSLPRVPPPSYRPTSLLAPLDGSRGKHLHSPDFWQLLASPESIHPDPASSPPLAADRILAQRRLLPAIVHHVSSLHSMAAEGSTSILLSSHSCSNVLPSPSPPTAASSSRSSSALARSFDVDLEQCQGRGDAAVQPHGC